MDATTLYFKPINIYAALDFGMSIQRHIHRNNKLSIAIFRSNDQITFNTCYAHHTQCGG